MFVRLVLLVFSSFVVESPIFSFSRPDMTFAVDWALSNNYLSIYPFLPLFFLGKSTESSLSSSVGESALVFFLSSFLVSQSCILLVISYSSNSNFVF